jgi:hypothetical protein
MERRSEPRAPSHPRRHRAPGDGRHVARRREDDPTPRHHPPAPKTGGGGASGFGPIDDDGFGKRPDRGGDDDARSFFLIALGILAMGAGVLSARMIADQRRKRNAFFS